VSAVSLSGLFQAGIDILHTAVNATTKKILIQTGSVTKQTTETDNVEWWQHVGFASRPSQPDPGKSAAQGFVVRGGDYDMCIASQDLRGLALYGNLADGETCLYAGGKDGNAQARLLLKADGSISAYTRKGNTASGAGMVIQVDAMNDAIRITNSKGYGIIIDATGISLTTGGSGAGMKLGGDGSWSLVGTGQGQIDGSSVQVGGAGVLPVNGVLVGPTGVSGVMSQKLVVALV